AEVIGKVIPAQRLGDERQDLPKVDVGDDAVGLPSRQQRRALHWPVSAMPLIHVERVAWGGYFFLKRCSKARRGSSGRADPDAVSRSTVTCSEKNVHALRAPL